MAENNKMLIVFEKVVNLTRIIGIPQMLKEISKIQRDYYQSPTIADFTIQLVCNKYKLSRKEFEQGITRKNKTRYIARTIFTDIASEIIGFSHRQIANDYLHCSRQQITEYRNFIRNLDTKLSQDKSVIDDLQEIKQVINKEYFNNKLNIN